MITPESLFAPPKPSTLDQPLDHLMACHRRIEQRLAAMERAAAGFDTRREEAIEAFASAFRFLDSSGVLHTADEEESLFPRLSPLLGPEGQTYLADLERDHATAHALYQQLKAALADANPTRGAVEPLAARLVSLYRRHIASEDDVLQTYAVRHLAPEQLQAIALEMKRRRAG